MIHHDYENAPYWGEPNSLGQKHLINIIVDIKNAVNVLSEYINNNIFEGEYCDALKIEVIKHICVSLIAYVQQEKSPIGNSSDNMHKALYCLLDYNLSNTAATEIFHKTETAIISCLMNVVPDIDDERKYKILDYKIIDKDGLHLTLEVLND